MSASSGQWEAASDEPGQTSLWFAVKQSPPLFLSRLKHRTGEEMNVYFSRDRLYAALG